MGKVDQRQGRREVGEREIRGLKKQRYKNRKENTVIPLKKRNIKIHVSVSKSTQAVKEKKQRSSKKTKVGEKWG